MKKLIAFIIICVIMTSCYTTKSPYYNKYAIQQTRCYK